MTSELDIFTLPTAFSYIVHGRGWHAKFRPGEQVNARGGKSPVLLASPAEIGGYPFAPFGRSPLCRTNSITNGETTSHPPGMSISANTPRSRVLLRHRCSDSLRVWRLRIITTRRLEGTHLRQRWISASRSFRHVHSLRSE